MSSPNRWTDAGVEEGKPALSIPKSIPRMGPTEEMRGMMFKVLLIGLLKSFTGLTKSVCEPGKIGNFDPQPSGCKQGEDVLHSQIARRQAFEVIGIHSSAGLLRGGT
jgi:hypothetical protein